jgi:hypothetical protein
MKKYILVPLLFGALILGSPNIHAQSDPPPDHGSSTDQAGGGAPIGGGLFILLGLGAAYAGKKIYQYKKQENDL